ncbi:peptidoglycan-binding protein [Clostridiaceae bacterium M8S5]|nr:peptidoglycan-binding protein [Clostridiaceae bacterium M8S5]
MKKNNRRLALLFIVIMSMALSSIAIYAHAGNHSWPLLRYGDKGTNVKTLKCFLKSKGYNLYSDGGEPSDYFDSATKSAVKSFQSANNLSADGIVGKNTWSKLIATVYYGVKSNTVRGLQYQLKEKYKCNLKVDGDFQYETKYYVNTFQYRAGLTEDGIVGPKTWNHLLSNNSFDDFPTPQ